MPKIEVHDEVVVIEADAREILVREDHGADVKVRCPVCGGWKVSLFTTPYVDLFGILSLRFHCENGHDFKLIFTADSDVGPTRVHADVEMSHNEVAARLLVGGMS